VIVLSAAACDATIAEFASTSREPRDVAEHPQRRALRRDPQAHLAAMKGEV